MTKHHRWPAMARIASASLALLAATHALASPLAVTESGDFPGDEVGSLDTGTNVIQGALGGSTDSKDIFQVRLLPGQRITRLLLSWTDMTGNNGSQGSWSGHAPDGSLFGGQVLYGGGSLELPLSLADAGLYEVSLSAAKYYHTFCHGPTKDKTCETETSFEDSGYTVSFEVRQAVTTVPEPRSLALVGLALAGLQITRRARPSR